MLEWIEQNESVLRLGFFFGILCLMGLWESFNPARTLLVSRAQRWMNNLGLVVLNTALLRIIFPTATVGMAVMAEHHGWGVLPQLSLSFGILVFISVILLDLIIWLQHVMVHAVPVLWRLHRVHHADPDYDVTTGLRFHPLEIILSMVIKFFAIVALGPPVVAVIIFEIVLNGMAMFNHGNVSLPAWLDKILRMVVVTPDMHRVHHSVLDHETNSNFGFNLSLWDRLFGTYRAQLDAGHQQMKIGIHGFDQFNQIVRLPGLLSLPFAAHDKDYVINRRSWPKHSGRSS